MPTYQYACTVCGHQLEAVQSFSDAPLTVCPECDGRLRKVFSSVGVVFKGSGFYRTDSRSGSSSAKESTTESAAPKADTTSTGAASSTSSSSAPSTSTGSSSSAPATPAASPAPAKKS